MSLPEPPDLSQQESKKNEESQSDKTMTQAMALITGKEEQTDGNTASDQEMMKMFASVWVKVEVEEEAPSEDPIALTPPMSSKTESSTRTSKTKRKKPLNPKQLFCEQCDYKTIYRNCLKAHVLGHLSEKPFQCEFCTYGTKYNYSLLRHRAIKHRELIPNVEELTKVETFRCDSCDYTTNYKCNLSSHKRKHKSDKQFECPYCDYKTAYKHHILKHNRTHQRVDQKFKCDKCPFETKHEGHIQRHLSKIHNIVMDKANRCDLCDFYTKEKWRINIHKRRSRRKEAIKCKFCEFESFYSCEFKKHKHLHIPEMYGNGRTLNPELKDDINEILKKQLENFKEVIEQPEMADVVEQGKSNKYAVDTNCVDWHSIQVLESDDKERPFQCHMCEYTSKFKASVQRHFQRHHTGAKNRPYKCLNCDFSTKTKDQIALHNKRSKSDQILYCLICGYTTIHKCALVMHQKLHNEYKCNVCTYTCRQKYDLTKHFAVAHLGDGLKCQFCDYKAARKESLLCHETIHTGEKPYKCNLCDYQSVRRCLLEAHKRKYHNTQKDITLVSEEEIRSLKVPIGKDFSYLSCLEQLKSFPQSQDDNLEQLKDYNLEQSKNYNLEQSKDYNLEQPKDYNLEQSKDYNLEQSKDYNYVPNGANDNPVQGISCDYNSSSNEQN